MRASSSKPKVSTRVEPAQSARRAPAKDEPPARARPTLGTLLRSLRTRNGWTLKEMGEHSGIPFSTLSKIERDRLTLTYDKLLQLSQRLRIPVSDLFAEPDSEGGGGRVTARRSLGKVDAAVHVNTPNYDYFYLFPELRRKRMVPILTTIRARTLSEFGDLVRHSGEEFFYVISGTVEVHTEFYDPVTLNAGESIYIDSNMGHAYVLGMGCDEAMVIGACANGEEDQMSTLVNLRHPQRKQES